MERRSLFQKAGSVQQLGVQYRATGGASDRVVNEHEESYVEDMTCPHAADRHRHSGTAIDVPSRLRRQVVFKNV